MRFTTAEREEGLSGRAGGEEDELEVAVVGWWGFAVTVEDAPVAVFFYKFSALCYFLEGGSPGHVPAPFALSQGLGGDTAAMSTWTNL